MPVSRADIAHLDNAVHQGIVALAHKAQRGDVVQHVLQIASWAGVGVYATERHILLCVEPAVLCLQSEQCEKCSLAGTSHKLPGMPHMNTEASVSKQANDSGFGWSC